MRDKKLLTTTFVSVLTLAVLHWTAGYFHLYWSLWWFDNVMHFLGGFSLALLAIWLARASGILDQDVSTLKLLIVSLVSVLLIGVGWEVFEYTNGLTQATELEYHMDVIHDLLADTVGAVFAVYWVRIRGLIPVLV